jgi:hypothetical protein
MFDSVTDEVTGIWMNDEVRTDKFKSLKMTALGLASDENVDFSKGFMNRQCEIKIVMVSRLFCLSSGKLN